MLERIAPLWRRPVGVGIELPVSGIPRRLLSTSILGYAPCRLGVRYATSPSSSSMRLMLADWACIDPLMDERGRPSGVRVPERDVRDMGRAKE